MWLAKLRRIGAAIVVALAAFAGAERADAVPSTSNVIFIVDESGSMAGEQAFLQSVVSDLDTELAAQGVTTRTYGVVGFGGFPSTPSGQPPAQGPTLVDAATAATALGNLTTSGGFEDGYLAIDFALNNFNFDPGAAINFILATDEDRDVTFGTNFTAASIIAALTSQNILLNAIVNAQLRDTNSAPALGIDNTGTAYIADGSGGFTTSTGGTAVSGFGSTIADYVNVASATGGAAWDLNQLRAGGSVAQSFNEAFIDIKVQEVITTPVPEPTTLAMLGVGLLGLGFAARRRAAV